MKNILKKIDPRKKTLHCLQCKQKLNIPIKPGKTLRITCPKCKTQFDIRFANPLRELFKWNKQDTFKQNIKQCLLTYKNLPLQSKLTIVVFFTLIFFLVAQFLHKQPESKPQNNNNAQQIQL